MRPSVKRSRFIEYLNYLTYREFKSLSPSYKTIDDFKLKTNIDIPKSTAYRIIKKYISLHREIDDKIIEINND